MSTVADRSLVAGDVYRTWKKRVRAASESVVVFGPYLDRLLDRLLKNSALEAEAVTVVTDLSPGSGTVDYQAQMIVVRAAAARHRGAFAPSPACQGAAPRLADGDDWDNRGCDRVTGTVSGQLGRAIQVCGVLKRPGTALSVPSSECR